MSTPYGSYCDDFYVNLRLGTTLPLPQGRDTALHFFEQIRRRFPDLKKLARTGVGDGQAELSLEGDRDLPRYRWVALEPQRLSVGNVNPESLDAARELPDRVLELAPYQLGLSALDVAWMEVLLGFDFEYAGNHDEAVAAALFDGSPLACLGDDVEGGNAVPLEFRPRTTVALDPELKTRARLEVVTRTDPHAVRTGEYERDAVSVYLSVRRQWDATDGEATPAAFAALLDQADDLASGRVLRDVLQPLSATIAAGD